MLYNNNMKKIFIMISLFIIIGFSAYLLIDNMLLLDNSVVKDKNFVLEVHKKEKLSNVLSLEEKH